MSVTRSKNTIPSRSYRILKSCKYTSIQLTPPRSAFLRFYWLKVSSYWLRKTRFKYHCTTSHLVCQSPLKLNIRPLLCSTPVFPLHLFNLPLLHSPPLQSLFTSLQSPVFNHPYSLTPSILTHIYSPLFVHPSSLTPLYSSLSTHPYSLTHLHSPGWQ